MAQRVYVIGAFMVTALGVSGVSLVAPVLPELSLYYDVRPGMMSLFQTAVMTTGVITAPLTAYLGLRLGLGNVLRVLLLLFGVAGLALLSTSNFLVAILLRLIQGAGSGGLVTVSFMAITRLGNPRKVRATGQNAAVISMMMVVLPMTGSLLGGIHIAAPFGFYGLAVLAAVLLPRALKDPPSLRTGTGSSVTGGPPAIVRAMLTLNVLTYVVVFGWLLLLTPLVLDDLGIDLALRGWALAAQSALGAVATVVTARLRERRYFIQLLLFGWAALAVVLGAAAMAPSVVTVLLLILSGAFFGVVNPAVVTIVSCVQGGRWLGWWQSSSRIGQVGGPLIAGVLYAMLTTPVVLVIGAGGSAITTVVACYSSRKWKLGVPDCVESRSA